MKVSRRISLMLLPAMLVLVAGIVLAAFLLFEGDRRATVAQLRQTAVAESLARLAQATDAEVLRLQAAVAQDTLPALQGAETGLRAPSDYFQKYQALRESPELPSEATQLGQRLDILVTTARRTEQALRAQRRLLRDTTAGLPLPVLSRDLDLLRTDIRALSTRLLDVEAEQHAAVLAGAQALKRYGFLALLMAGAISTVLILLAWTGLRTMVAKPVYQLRAALDRGREFPTNDDSELGQIGAHLNQLQVRQAALAQAVQRMAQGDYHSTPDPDQVSDPNAAALASIAQRVHELSDERHRLDSEAGRLRATVAEKDARVTQLEAESAALAAKLNAVESTLAIAELDDNGHLVYADNVFSQLSGYSADELRGRDLRQLAAEGADADPVPAILQTVREGRTWYGVVQNQAKNGSTFWLASAITPLKANGSGNGRAHGKYLLAGYEISTLKHQEQELRSSLATVSSDLEQYKANIERLQGEQHSLVRNFESQKQLEYRLMQQQSALQELTRNSDLKEGNVREALRSVTETTAYALDEERVGLWLFTENGTKLRCLDLYERSAMRHYDSVELRQGEHAAFFDAVQQEGLLPVEDARTDARTAVLADGYLAPAGLRSLLSAPIHLGGSIVGLLMAEHPGDTPRAWTLDEQNFLMSVADVVSLALEQGNRKVMEEELRMTLEESQALEEELRQNAEEIEATNEEMRRTQAELKGQISALNNSAIVSESNPTGLITYANAEFARLYGYDKKELLGQDHRILKSGHHPPAFFAHLWSTIGSGKVWKGEIRNRTREGADIWVALTVTPVVGVDGKPYKFIGVGFNVTAQKLQEAQIQAALEVATQQQELLRQNADELEYANDEMRRTQIELAGQINALNNSSLVYETDMEGNVTYVNEALLDISGYERDELLGHRYTLLKSGNQPDAIYQEQWRTVLRGQIWKGELELKTRLGQAFWVLITNTPVLGTNNEPIKSINVMFDITTQKLQEFRLKRQQAALLEVTSHPAVKEGLLEEAYEVITRIGMETLDAARVSLWLFEDGGSNIRCVASRQVPGHDHPHHVGTVLDRELYPVYFRTLERDRVVAANDATNDPRTKELANTLFKPQHITSVLDASIRQAGNSVGLISIEHRGHARSWTLDEQAFSTSLADAVGLVLEQKERLLTDKLKMAYSELEEKNLEVVRQKAEIEEQTRFLTESIKYAKRIQTNILPAKEFIEQHIPNFFIVYRPRDIVGGDFYWFAPVGNKKVVVVADGTGHGVPGAFLTLIGYLLLNQIVNERGITRPADILYHLHIGVRTALKQDEEGSESRDGMDVAIVTIDTESKLAQFAGANLPFNYYQDWELHVIKPDKYSIGGEQMEEERVFTNHEVQLKAGDAVYLYTDGFVDQMGGPEEKRFSTRRFRDLVLRTQHESMATQRALVNLEWKEWKDDREQLDDVTVFGFRVD